MTYDPLAKTRQSLYSGPKAPPPWRGLFGGPDGVSQPPVRSQGLCSVVALRRGSSVVVPLLLRHVRPVVGYSASVTLSVTRGVWERDTLDLRRSPTSRLGSAPLGVSCVFLFSGGVRGTGRADSQNIDVPLEKESRTSPRGSIAPSRTTARRSHSSAGRSPPANGTPRVRPTLLGTRFRHAGTECSSPLPAAGSVPPAAILHQPPPSAGNNKSKSSDALRCQLGLGVTLQRVRLRVAKFELRCSLHWAGSASPRAETASQAVPTGGGQRHRERMRTDRRGRTTPRAESSRTDWSCTACETPPPPCGQRDKICATRARIVHLKAIPIVHLAPLVHKRCECLGGGHHLLF